MTNVLTMNIAVFAFHQELSRLRFYCWI